MNQELKQQAHKEFDKIFSQEKTPEGRSYLYDKEAECSVNPLIMKDFLDSLIDRTVQMTEERVVGIAKQIKNFITIHSQAAIMEFVNYRKLDEKMATEIQDSIIDIVDDAFNTLITNKSDINNNKETL